MVVNSSKLIEKFASSALATLLEIDLENSKILGNKSSAISFKQKIDLLTEIKAFDRDDVGKFMKFMEIRNQFAHNFEVESFEICFKVLSAGTEKYLVKLFPKVSKEKKSREQYLTELFTSLFSSLLHTCGLILSYINAKIEADVKKEFEEKFYPEFIEELKTYAYENEEFADFYNEALEKLINKK